MNTFIKLMTTAIILAGTSGQIHAKGNMDDERGKHQRPSFESLDIDENSEIDFDEFSTKPLPHGDHDTVFDDIDTDSDGIISVDEFNNHKPPQHKRRSRGERDD